MQLINIISDIIKHLPNSHQWSIDQEHSNDYKVTVNGINGRSMVFISRSSSGKASIHGGWKIEDPSSGQYMFPRDFQPINVSLSRPPEKLANDIQRRFIAKYEETFAQLLTEQQEMLEHINSNNTKIDKLNKIINSKPLPHTQELTPQFFLSRYHKVKFLYNGTVDLSLSSISFDDCLAILDRLYNKR